MLVESKGISKEAAVHAIESQCRGVLLPDLELEFHDADLKGCTVADVLADPERFAGRPLADPIEGVSYGRQTAMVMLRRSDGQPWIKSFAHGGIFSYSLRDDRVPKTAAPDARVAAETDETADPRLAKLDKKWIALGCTGEGAEEYASRRMAAVAFAVECLKVGVGDEDVAEFLDRWEIGRGLRNARIVVLAHEFLDEPKLFEMNEKHAVLPIGGKTRVATWGEDPTSPATTPS